MIKIVDAFNLSRLNGPFTVQPLAKFSQGATLLQINALIFPELKQRSKFSTGKRSPALRQVGDWFPGKDHRVCFTRSGAQARFFFIAFGLSDCQLQRRSDRIPGCVFNVKHAARFVRMGFRRSVNDERAHHNDSTLLDQARYMLCLADNGFNLLIAQDTPAMAAWNDSQWAIFRVRIIKMEPQRYNSLQRTGWSVRVDYAFFRRPRSPARHLVFVAERYSCVLVPGNQ